MIAKHHSRNHLTREKRRLRPLLSATLFRVLFREFDFVLRKRRLQHHLAIKSRMRSLNCDSADAATIV